MLKELLYVVDTHVLIWYFTGSTRLLPALKERIEDARSQGGRLLVPTIVLAEVLDIAEKERVSFDFAQMYRLIQDEAEFEIVDFGQEIFDETVRVKGIEDIHDRIIVATARYYWAGVLTKDHVIRESGEVETL